ncbi:hypothetical protein ASF22_02600 [Methylobacterium sp. Leaf87]|uniref:hypothetical protein n=1 Tax=Methylobacterium sp. Leaf87 TaxID=1736243 RepID=UPI0006F71F42|nr:hypothetical protein [Methylobacterium sp. Leaf87]KQO69517.1 hypothetical protein ASF22_02600 [Methylobacterium sp. Leaf87]
MTAPEDQNGLREALARAEAERDAAQKLGDEWYAAWEWSNQSAIRQGVKLAAAEAEITRLKEGMEGFVLVPREPTAEMLSAGAAGSGEDSEAVAAGAWAAMIVAVDPG